MTGEVFPGALPKEDGCGWIWGMKPESLTKHRATGVDDPLFLDSLDIYRTSFPVHEQRRVQDFPLAFQDPGFCYEVFLNGEGRVVAMLVSWQREAFVYLEYFAVDASLRGQGAGQRILEELRDAFPTRLFWRLILRRTGFHAAAWGFTSGTALCPIPSLITFIPLIRMKGSLSPSC